MYNSNRSNGRYSFIIVTVYSSLSTVYVHPEYNLDDCFIMDEQSELTTYDVPDNEEGRKEYICVIDEMTKTEDS